MAKHNNLPSFQCHHEFSPWVIKFMWISTKLDTPWILFSHTLCEFGRKLPFKFLLISPTWPLLVLRIFLCPFIETPTKSPAAIMDLTPTLSLIDLTHGCQPSYQQIPFVWWSNYAPISPLDNICANDTTILNYVDLSPQSLMWPPSTLLHSCVSTMICGCSKDVTMCLLPFAPPPLWLSSSNASMTTYSHSKWSLLQCWNPSL